MYRTIMFGVPRPTLTNRLHFMGSLVTMAMGLRHTIVQRDNVIASIENSCVTINGKLLIFRASNGVRVPLCTLSMSFLLVLATGPFNHDFTTNSLLRVIFTRTTWFRRLLVILRGTRLSGVHERCDARE